MYIAYEMVNTNGGNFGHFSVMQIISVLGGLHSTVMCELSKNFTTVLWRQKKSLGLLKWFENARKSEKTAQNPLPKR